MAGLVPAIHELPLGRVSISRRYRIYKISTVPRRFINRRYHLTTPDLTPLLKNLIQNSGIDFDRLQFPQLHDAQRAIIEEVSPITLIARYMGAYGIPARDVFEVMDILQTCASLTRDAPLLMSYLLPLILSRTQGGHAGELIEPSKPRDAWNYVLGQSYKTPPTTMDCWALAQGIRRASEMDQKKLLGHLQKTDGDHVGQLVFHVRSQAISNSLADPGKYGTLLETVGRFQQSTTERMSRYVS